MVRLGPLGLRVYLTVRTSLVYFVYGAEPTCLQASRFAHAPVVCIFATRVVTRQRVNAGEKYLSACSAAPPCCTTISQRGRRLCCTKAQDMVNGGFLHDFYKVDRALNLACVAVAPRNEDSGQQHDYYCRVL